MKRYFILCAAIAAIIFTFSSCDELTYSPHLENPVQIEKPQVKMRIDLVDTADTLFINGACDLYYNIDTGGKKFLMMRIYVDSDQAAETTDTTHYEFSPSKYSYGYHTLTLETWVRSGSGSLAAAHGNEFLVSSRKWTIYINLNNSGKGYLSIYPKDGRLKITWDKNIYRDFMGYVIYRSPDPGNTYASVFVASIKDPDQNYWIDSSYTGGDVKYTVTSKNLHQTYYYEGRFTDEKAFIYPIVKDQNGGHIIKWKKNKYYANMKSYTLQASLSNYDYKSLAVKTSWTDTSFYYAPEFGAKVQYRVLVNNNGEWPDLQSDTACAYSGNDFYHVITIESYPSTNSLYVMAGYTGFLRMDASTFAVTGRTNRTISISRNGKYAYLAENSGEYSGDRYYNKYDPVTLQPEKSLYIKNILGFDLSSGNFCVTADGYVFAVGGKYTPGKTSSQKLAVLLDFENSKVLYCDSSSHNYSGSFVKISAQSEEGEYIMSGDGYLYNLKNKIVTRIDGVRSNDAVFMPSGKEYVVLGNRNISLYRCSDNTLLKTFTITDDLAKWVIDPVTGYFGGCVVGKLKYRIYDVYNGILKKEITVAIDMTSWSYPSCYLANSMLFSSEGCYIKVQY